MKIFKKWIGIGLAAALILQPMSYVRAEEGTESLSGNPVGKLDIALKEGESKEVTVPYYEDSYQEVNGIEPVKFESSDSNVATAYKTGFTAGSGGSSLSVMIAGRTAGTAEITVSMRNTGDILAKYLVTVNQGEASALNLCLGQETEFTLDYNTKNFTYEFGSADIECKEINKSTSQSSSGGNYISKTVLKMSFSTLGNYTLSFYDDNKKTIKQVTLNISNHEYSESWTTDKGSTCTEEGSESRHCNKCSEKTDIRPIPKTEHIYSDKWTTDKKATCTEEGSESRHCNKCSEKTDIRSIPKTEHAYSEKWTVDKEATCIEEGSESRHCMTCSKKADVREITKTKHEYNTPDFVWTKNMDACEAVFACQNCTNIKKVKCQIDINTVKQATCTQDGEKQYVAKCTLDSKQFEDSQTAVVKTAGHDFRYNWNGIWEHTVSCNRCFYYVEKEDCEFKDEKCKFCGNQLPETYLSIFPDINIYTGVPVTIDMSLNGSTGRVTSAYYLDKDCTVKTDEANSGALSSGTEPAEVGIYYLRVNIESDDEYAGVEKIFKIEIVPENPEIAFLIEKEDGVRIFWNQIESTDGYYIYRYDSSDGTPDRWRENLKKIGEVKGGNTTNYLDKDVVRDVEYQYVVFSYKEGLSANTLVPSGYSITPGYMSPPLFIDTDQGAWYYEAVNYVFSYKLMSGYSEPVFSADGASYGPGFGPSDELSRGQFATILYRMEDSAQIEFQPVFSDVENGKFYSLPAVWANGAGVISGYSNGCFGAGDSMTREQLATMMYRYAKYKGFNTSNRADLTKYPDYQDVSGFSVEAMRWAVGVGLISGDQGKLNPQGTSSRAVTAVIIQRFMEAY